MTFITSYSAIRNNRIFENGELLFSGSPNNTTEEFLQATYDFLNPDYPKFYKMDHLSRLGFLASHVLLKGQTLNKEYPAEKVAVVLSNASSSLDTDKKFIQSTQKIASPSLFVYTLPNIVAAEICICHGLKGENAFFVFEHFDASFIAGYADQVMARGAQSCIAGWVENNGDGHDVFLYLVENQEKNKSMPHTCEMVSKLYKQEHGTIKD